ncbi:MAG: hypothetical protein U0169_06345 [Polyangiaceae bacterium]
MALDTSNANRWPDIESLRALVGAIRGDELEGAAQEFARILATRFPSVVLARVFAVLPFGILPGADRAFALEHRAGGGRVEATTPVLSLLGTSGTEATWSDRTASKAHLAIPLLDHSTVRGAPMVAKLLADLEVNLAALDDGRPIATRKLLGGKSGTFYVLDAQTARDEEGRPIIGAKDFVDKHRVRTVFGMGSAYRDGTLVVAVVFTRELVARLHVDRYADVVAAFKSATADLVLTKRIHRDGPRGS